MCRNIKTLANFEPPATEDEIRASALQFVRKLSGASRLSRANEAAFNRAVDEVTAAADRLIHSLTTNAPPRNRDEECRDKQRCNRADAVWTVTNLPRGVAGALQLRRRPHRTRRGPEPPRAARARLHLGRL